MRATDVMTTRVITVEPTTSVKDLAALLSERGISGVPVVEHDRVVGIVSEGDLLHRAETGTERRTQPRRSRWFDDRPREESARDYVKSHARKVKDVMTRKVISVAETAELAEVAAVMETNRIKRVPVLHNGKLVGIISRANLVRALAAVKTEPIAAIADDPTIRQKLLAELSRRDWVKLWAADVIVKDGIVHFWLGEQPEAERRALHVAAENIPGVRGVEEHIVPAPVMPGF
jgi:CBS domain-containing protein